jgi:Flp pilus assembly pilin Flp
MFTPPPWLSYLLILLSVRLDRARNAPSKGASAVEWVLITAIIAGALGLATLIRTLVEERQTEIENAFNGGGSGGYRSGGDAGR